MFLSLQGSSAWTLVGTVCRSTDWRRQSLTIADSRAFDNRVNGVRSYVFQGFYFAVGPANFDGFHFFRGAQAEVKPQIVLREIATAAVDFALLLHACCANGYLGSDCRAVALGADEFEQYAMETVGIHILEKRGWLADIQQENVNIAGVKNVAESGAAPGLQG